MTWPPAARLRLTPCSSEAAQKAAQIGKFKHYTARVPGRAPYEIHAEIRDASRRRNAQVKQSAAQVSALPGEEGF
ncbi:MAG TPA: hypothetical protein PLP93_08185 [Nitrosomonas sp.]|nr:hypothetical protein [Nitrosomonas sp.]HRB46168.1 hypothetical protein [Nitrosomonas sp.]